MNDYKSLMQWSQNYKNIYNAEKGFMLPANITENGSIWMIITDTDLPKDQNGLICFVFFKIFPE